MLLGFGRLSSTNCLVIGCDNCATYNFGRGHDRGLSVDSHATKSDNSRDRSGFSQRSASPSPRPGRRPSQAVGVQNVNQSNVTTGLQVILQLKNHDKPMTKIFILGGA